MKRHQTKAFTLVELLVVIAIIGILIALLLPAIQAAREAARRVACVNNMTQIGLAIQSYIEANEALPAGVVNPKGPINTDASGYKMGWITQILPYFEESTTYAHIDFKAGVFDKKNAPVREIAISTLLCPSYGGETVLSDDTWGGVGGGMGMGMPPVMDDMSDMDMDEPGMGMGGGGINMGGPGMGGGMVESKSAEAGKDEPAGDQSKKADKADSKTDSQAGKKDPADTSDKPVKAKPLTRGTRAICNYAGCHNHTEAPIDENNTGVFILNRPIRCESITDGLSHTIFIGEKLPDDNDLGWMAGTRATLRNTGTAINGTPSAWDMDNTDMGMPVNNPLSNKLFVGGFGSEHPGVANMLLGDGAVQSFSADISLPVLQQLGHRADGKLIKTRDY